MFDLSDTQLDLPHLQFIVRALHDLAETDGIHDIEQVLLRGFYEQCQNEAHALTSFDELTSGPFDPGCCAELFTEEAQRAMFLQSCLLLAYADGTYSAGERAKVAEYARALGVSDESLTTLEEGVRDHLMQQISQIENTDALQEVAREMAAED